MNSSSRHFRPRNIILCASLAAVAIFTAVVAVHLGAQDPTEDAAYYKAHPEEMLLAYRHVEVASVADAQEQLFSKRMYMSHKMQSLFPTKFAGYAVTVQLKKEENKDPNALQPMMQAIDDGQRNSVYVMAIQDGADIAGMGGLMGTAMFSRNYAGAIIDGGVRDTAYLKKIGFPVYATGIVASTSVGHYRATAGAPLVCDGVPIAPGDIIAADQDGVVVIPVAVAPETLVRAQTLDFQEHSMYAVIEKYKSLLKAVAEFHRL
jgi:regulator of RNase E activity RraA